MTADQLIESLRLSGRSDALNGAVENKNLPLHLRNEIEAAQNACMAAVRYLSEQPQSTAEAHGAAEPYDSRGPTTLEGWRSAALAGEKERDWLREQLATALRHQGKDCWYWQNDGEDHLESLTNSLPVVIRADHLRELLNQSAIGLCDRICDAIQAADDKSMAEAGYMLDCNDCCRIVRDQFAASNVQPKGTALLDLTCSHANRSYCALYDPKASQHRPTAEWYRAKIAETEGLDDNLPCGGLATQAPSPAPEAVLLNGVLLEPLTEEQVFRALKAAGPINGATVRTLARYWQTHPLVAKAQAPAPTQRGGVDCIGLALDLEARAKTVESQTTERVMKAAAHGLRLLASAQAPAVAHEPLTREQVYALLPQRLRSVEFAASEVFSLGDVCAAVNAALAVSKPPVQGIGE